MVAGNAGLLFCSSNYSVNIFALKQKLAGCVLSLSPLLFFKKGVVNSYLFGLWSALPGAVPIGEYQCHSARPEYFRDDRFRRSNSCGQCASVPDIPETFVEEL